MDSTIDPARSGGAAGTSRLRSLMQIWMAKPTPTGLIGALQDGKSRKFDSDFVINTMCGVFNACYSTLYAITGSVVLTVLTNRHIMKSQNNVATDEAAQEIIRYTSPAQGTMRFAVDTAKIGDTIIERGDAVIVLFGAANRDPEKFHMPSKLLLDRSPNPHLGFGWGSHFCIGASVASRWVRELLSFLQVEHESLTMHEEATFMNLATLRCPDKLQLGVRRQ